MKLVKCANCGKQFILSGGGHLYKLIDRDTNKTKNYCGYNCWRKAGGDNGLKYNTRK